MPLWGDKELIAGANGGTIEVFANGTVTGDGTTFDTDISVGNYIAAGGNEYRVVDVTNANSLEVVAGQTGQAVANVAAASTFTVNEKPIYLSAASTNDPATDVYFVDTTEASVANNATKGIDTPGWVKYTTQTGAGGTRHRAEVLVAMKRSPAEAGDVEDIVTEDS